MKKLVLVSILTVCLVASAQASMFASNGHPKRESQIVLGADISAYVTSMHRSSVRASNAKDKGHPGWLLGKGRYKQYMKSISDPGDGPSFGDAIILPSPKGKKGKPMGWKNDSGLGVKDASNNGMGHKPKVDMSGSCMFMGDDVGDVVLTDDIGAASAPIPAAVWLGMFGLGVVGVKLRKYA